uniref:Uncharacterized protein n=1 Tax=Lepeophtheirus salmonis TaxID=72036 RepID=A0A0K2UI30_LEPSM
MKHTHHMLKKPKQKIVKLWRQNMNLLVHAFTGHGATFGSSEQMEKYKCNVQYLHVRTTKPKLHY